MKLVEENNKKICVLVLITVMDRAGAETVMMNYLRHMDRSKFQIDFLINRKDRADYEEEIEKLGSKVYHMSPLFPGKFHWYKKEFRKFLREHREYRVIHSHLEERSYFALKIAKEEGVPVRIAHGHSVPKERNLKMLLRLYFRKRLKKYYTHAFACGQKPAKWLFGDGENVTIMRNAVDTENFQYNEQVRHQVRKELGLGEEELVIGHIGRFVPEKNQKFLIDIFESVNSSRKDSKLLLIGGGKPKAEIKYKKQVEEKVKAKRLQNSVKFLGVRVDVNRLMWAMDVLVMPSVTEGFPVTLVEAQASGLPCVVADTISDEIRITERIQYQGLSDQEEDWANKILSICHEKVFEKKETREEMTDRVKAAGFDIRENAKWLEAFYEGNETVVPHESGSEENCI